MSGDLDFQTARTVNARVDELLAGRPVRLVLSVGGLTFIDSTGLAVLVHAWQASVALGTVLELAETPAFLTSVLEITGIGELLRRPTPAAGEEDVDSA